LHDVFHDIVGACNNKEEKHGNHDGHGHWFWYEIEESVVSILLVLLLLQNSG
jgi:hypothetical protein